MSALARYYHSKGAKVSGYDKTQSSLTVELEKEGMVIHYEENLALISKEAEMVVYTPAVPKDHKELVYYQQNGYKVVKRSDVLQIITESSFNICIAGTHGKTTISTMIAHLLRHTGYGCNAFLGGISVNYGTNFWSSERNVCVVEADEYDRSFLKLFPDVAIISAMDADHLDIYGTAKSMENAFINFSNNVKADGMLLSKFGLKRANELAGGKQVEDARKHLTYSLQNESADVFAENIRMMNGSYEFDVVMSARTLRRSPSGPLEKENIIENVVLHMGGMHNVENVVVAIAVASSLGIDNKKIKAAVEDFKGVKRRFEYVIAPRSANSPLRLRRGLPDCIIQAGVGGEVVFVDDYAHHPEELRALINGAKSLFSHRKCTVIFQPHLYTRTRDFADGFAEVLDLADEVILLPIYPARELPIEGVESEMILDKMKNEHKRVLTKVQLMNWMKNDFSKTVNKDFGEVLITAGAGDIDTLIEPIKKELKDL